VWSFAAALPGRASEKFEIAEPLSLYCVSTYSSPSQSQTFKQV
jgi:hypothetical protein